MISYYQIYTFHPSLNLGNIVIFRSFEQNAEETYDLSHFRQEHVPFFDRLTFRQLKDATSAILAREKATSLVGRFSVGLKFTINTLNNWFSSTVQPKFLELNKSKKQVFIMENTLIHSQAPCSICGFLLDVEAKGESKRFYC